MIRVPRGVKALYYEKSRVGKRIKRSKKKHLWKVSIDDHEHSVELYVSKLSNKRKVLVDGDIRTSTKATSGTQFTFPFRLSNHQFVVTQQEHTWDLMIDSVPFQMIYANQRPSAGFNAEGEWAAKPEAGDWGGRGETGDWGGRASRGWEEQPQKPESPKGEWGRSEEPWEAKKEEKWGYGLVTKQEESWTTKKKDDRWGRDETWTSKKEEPWGGRRTEERQESPREEVWTYEKKREERWEEPAEAEWGGRAREDDRRFQTSPRYSEPKPRQSPQERPRRYVDDYEAEARRPRPPAPERPYESLRPEKPKAPPADTKPVDFFAPPSESGIPSDLFSQRPTKEAAPQLQFPTMPAPQSTPPAPEFPSAQPSWQTGAPPQVPQPQWGQPMMNPMAAMMMNQYYTAMAGMKPGANPRPY